MKVSIKYWFKEPLGVLMLMIYFVCQLISALLGVWLIKYINVAIGSPNMMDYLMSIILLLIIPSILDAVGAYIKRYGRSITYTKLNNLFTEHILSLEYSVFTRYSCSNIITISEQINNMVGLMIRSVDALSQFIRIIIVIVAMYTIIPQSIIPYVLIYTAGAVIIKKLFYTYGKHQMKSTNIQKSRNQEIDEIINGFNEVRSFNTQQMHMKSIKMKNVECLNIINYLAKLNFVISMFANEVNDIGVILALFFVYNKIQTGSITVAMGISMVHYSMQIINGLIYMLDLTDEVADMVSKAPQFDELMKCPHDTDGEIELVDFNSKIEMSGVSFQYDDSNSVLNDINITINKGEKIGICGVSGGGKTTLLKLLSRFYRPTKGKISIDGIDLNELRIDSVRSRIGVVNQDAYIFNMSIKDNIRYGKNVTDSEVVEASKKAGLYDFIKTLPDGFDTVVGPRGLKLSGGQKQRISLARVFVKDPEIVLLDEATSALDNQSESIVQQSLEQLKDKTIITVAHRLSTIRNSDRIVVIDNHTIAGIGNHDELLTSCEAYQKLMK